MLVRGVALLLGHSPSMSSNCERDTESEHSSDAAGPRPRAIRSSSFYRGLGPNLPGGALLKLKADGDCVVDDGLTSEEVDALRATMLDTSSGVDFRRTVQAMTIRRDKIGWLSEGDCKPGPLRQAVHLLKGIAAELEAWEMAHAPEDQEDVSQAPRGLWRGLEVTTLRSSPHNTQPESPFK